MNFRENPSQTNLPENFELQSAQITGYQLSRADYRHYQRPSYPPLPTKSCPMGIIPMPG